MRAWSFRSCGLNICVLPVPSILAVLAHSWDRKHCKYIFHFEPACGRTRTCQICQICQGVQRSKQHCNWAGPGLLCSLRSASTKSSHSTGKQQVQIASLCRFYSSSMLIYAKLYTKSNGQTLSQNLENANRRTKTLNCLPTSQSTRVFSQGWKILDKPW